MSDDFSAVDSDGDVHHPAEQRARGRGRKPIAVFCAELVGAHIEGRRVADSLIERVRARPGGDELSAAVAHITGGKSKQAEAHSRGFFRRIQAALEKQVPA